MRIRTVVCVVESKSISRGLAGELNIVGTRVAWRMIPELAQVGGRIAPLICGFPAADTTRLQAHSLFKHPRTTSVQHARAAMAVECVQTAVVERCELLELRELADVGEPAKPSHAHAHADH